MNLPSAISTICILLDFVLSAVGAELFRCNKCRVKCALKQYEASTIVFKGLIPRQRNSSRETVYAKYGWLGMNDSIEFSHFVRLRTE